MTEIFDAGQTRDEEDEMYRERAEAAEAALANAQQQLHTNEGLLSELEVQVADLDGRVKMAEAVAESVTKAIAELRSSAETLFGFSLSSQGNGQNGQLSE